MKNLTPIVLLMSCFIDCTSQNRLKNKKPFAFTHVTLMDNAESAQYEVKLLSIELLGSLHVTQAIPVLESVLKESGDIDFRVAAKKALVEIQRVVDASK